MRLAGPLRLVGRRALRAALPLLATALALLGGTAGGQQAAASSRADSLYALAQRLALAGNTAAGRALVDSVLRSAPTGSPDYVNGLFWRATLAASGEEARQDYLRIVVEYPLSARAEHALLRLAQYALSRGDTAAAREHLERLGREHPAGTTRAQGAFWLGRVLLDEGAVQPACAALDTALARAAPGDVELRNQVAYYARSCAAARQAEADSVRADSLRADSVARADSARRASATDRAGRAAARGATRWSVQVAAFSSKADADRLAQRLVSRGLDARVTTDRPYRVRIGRFATRSEALALATRLRAEKTTAIVVEAERP